MPRPVLLYSGQWTDLPLAELAPKLAEWGYQGLELVCWGDHFEVKRALSEPHSQQTIGSRLRTENAGEQPPHHHRCL
jgi:sugar phosphate isomerase/epimerase